MESNTSKPLNFKTLRPILLASKSPRRSQLLSEAGLVYRVETADCEENYPDTMVAAEVPVFLAEKKAKAAQHLLQKKEVLLTADTVVILDGEIIGKPKGRTDAVRILKKLSGRIHTVITGVCLMDKTKKECFSARSNVHFGRLTKAEIDFYIDHYAPMDKAGSYGIQDWIGHCKVNKIVGTYTNIMGLPVNKVFAALQGF